MGRKLAPRILSFLAVVACAVLTAAIIGVFRGSPQNRVQNLSAVASSTSAMVAAIVALWVAWREADNREQARLESKQKEFNARKRNAALIAGNILAWCDRKDVQDVLTNLAKIESAESLAGYVKLAVIARRAPTRAGEPDSTFWGPHITYIGRAIQLGALRQLSDIPNLWSVQSSRERQNDITGIDPDFFASMDTIWTNLEMSVPQLERLYLTLQSIQKDGTDLLEMLVPGLADEAMELKAKIFEFVDTARAAARDLLVYTEEAIPPSLRAPTGLLAKSRERSPSLTERLRLASFSQNAPAVAGGMNGLSQAMAEADKMAQEILKGIDSQGPEPAPEDSNPDEPAKQDPSEPEEHE